MKINLLGNGNLYIEDNNFEEGFNYVYILQLNLQLTNSTNFGCSKIRNKIDDVIVFEDLADGHYSLCKLTIPTLDYRNDHPDDVVYYTDGEKFYKDGEEVSLQELVDCAVMIPKDYLGFFSTIHLKKEYVSICEKIFENNFEYKCHKNKIDNELIYKRDLLKSAYDIIQYLIDYCNFEEAEKILERISGCNGLYNVKQCCCNI